MLVIDRSRGEAPFAGRTFMCGRALVALSFVAVAAVAAVAASADGNWPQFRGQQAGVAADDPALPDTWGPTENVVWTSEVPGVGWSSPVVWGDHIFVTSAINSE